jgi:hypothetical protein
MTGEIYLVLLRWDDDQQCEPQQERTAHFPTHPFDF